MCHLNLGNPKDVQERHITNQRWSSLRGDDCWGSLSVNAVASLNVISRGWHRAGLPFFQRNMTVISIINRNYSENPSLVSVKPRNKLRQHCWTLHAVEAASHPVISQNQQKFIGESIARISKAQKQTSTTLLGPACSGSRFTSCNITESAEIYRRIHRSYQ
ncbi:hypothetical protein J6590_072048 [Homalodisca vitripennis]|nr:hypothetical protein J6590_072048 [Homalodisca vitripennis]